MSMPNIPSVNPDIKINWDQAITLILSSIAFEELGLAHIINAEAEKQQYVLGTLAVSDPPDPPTIDELLAVSESVATTLRSVMSSQMMLQYTLEDAIKYYGKGIA